MQLLSYLTPDLWEDMSLIMTVQFFSILLLSLVQHVGERPLLRNASCLSIHSRNLLVHHLLSVCVAEYDCVWHCLLKMNVG